MTIFNTSNKIITFGAIMCVPNKQTEIPDSFAQNPVLSKFCEMGMVTVVSKPKKAVEPKIEPVETDTEAEKPANRRKSKKGNGEDAGAPVSEANG